MTSSYADASMMIVKLKAPGIVTMILFIPLILALGVVLAFIVPLLALVTALSAITFLGVFILAKAGLVKKQQAGIGSSLEKEADEAKSVKKGNVTIDVKDYKIKED